MTVPGTISGEFYYCLEQEKEETPETPILGGFGLMFWLQSLHQGQLSAGPPHEKPLPPTWSAMAD